MTSQFSVLQYVPDPLADERINVGVIAYDDSEQAFRVLKDWHRVERFAGHPAAHLRASVLDLLDELAEVEPTDLPGRLGEWRSGWHGSLTLTPPRVSLDPPERVLDDIAASVLKESPTRTRTQTKSQVVASVRRELEGALNQVTEGLGTKLVGTRVDLAGRRIHHEVDLAVRNGHVMLAAQAISFARPESRSVERDVGALAWLLEDVASTSTAPPIDVVVAPPRDPERRDYQTAMRLFGELANEVVQTQSIERWAQTVAARIAPAENATAGAGS